MAEHQWVKVLDQNNLPVLSTDFKVIAACGIGNPKAFFDQVNTRYEMIDSIPLPDHFDYNLTWLQEMTQRCQSEGVDALMITEKDWVKIAPLLPDLQQFPNILRPQLGMRFTQGEGALIEAIKTLFEPEPQSSISTPDAMPS